MAFWSHLPLKDGAKNDLIKHSTGWQKNLASSAGLNTRFVLLLLFPMPPGGLICWVTMSLPSSFVAIFSFDFFLQELSWRASGIFVREWELRRRKSAGYSKRKSLMNPSTSFCIWERSICGCHFFYWGIVLSPGSTVGLQGKQFICNNKEEISGKNVAEMSKACRNLYIWCYNIRTEGAMYESFMAISCPPVFGNKDHCLK